MPRSGARCSACTVELGAGLLGAAPAASPTRPFDAVMGAALDLELPAHLAPRRLRRGA